MVEPDASKADPPAVVDETEAPPPPLPPLRPDPPPPPLAISVLPEKVMLVSVPVTPGEHDVKAIVVAPTVTLYSPEGRTTDGPKTSSPAPPPPPPLVDPAPPPATIKMRAVIWLLRVKLLVVLKADTQSL